MHQPIHWHEWGEEAFALAQRENKPILLDIGAVWCHWCHVMDRESYDSPEVAQLINERFVAIKVDRDERPDIDSRYQVAVSSISGQGGWPLTAFLTPDGKPFYGGTYFPPVDGYGRPSFRRVLTSISDAYHNKNADVMEQAQMVETAIAQAESFHGQSGDFSPGVIDAIVESALRSFDERYGGFGQAPKFPHPGALDLLMDNYMRTANEQVRSVFVESLEKMAQGGIYDQLGGGFHRYSVDERWIVPHFEKMSYDNSELLKNYVHAYQVTGEVFFADVARDIIRWMDEWLSDRERGGFYASQDADYSMDDDGDYFTWTLDEARSVLSEEEADVACIYYDINEIGEMHHNPAKNVLYVRASIEEVAVRLKITRERVAELLASAKAKMYAARLQRPTPYVDKTIYTGWNALCISAYLEAAKVLGLNDAMSFALRSLDRILTQVWDEKGLRHVVAYSDPEAQARDIPGGLDDYAFTANACLDAYEATGDLRYFTIGGEICKAMVKHFFDPVGGGFFDTQSNEEKSLGVLSSRRKPFQDSPTPAGNSMAAIALMRLHGYTGESTYHDKAEETLEAIAGMAGKFGIFAATYGIAAVHLAYPHTQVVIIGEGDAAQALRNAAVSHFTLNQSVLSLGSVAGTTLPPVLRETIPNLPGVRENHAEAVVCTNFACQPPVSDPVALRKQLSAAS
jgi:uncharacterized protein YyaL (SSP411 family)